MEEEEDPSDKKIDKIDQILTDFLDKKEEENDFPENENYAIKKIEYGVYKFGGRRVNIQI